MLEEMNDEIDDELDLEEDTTELAWGRSKKVGKVDFSRDFYRYLIGNSRR